MVKASDHPWSSRVFIVRYEANNTKTFIKGQRVLWQVICVSIGSGAPQRRAEESERSSWLSGPWKFHACTWKYFDRFCGLCGNNPPWLSFFQSGPFAWGVWLSCYCVCQCESGWAQIYPAHLAAWLDVKHAGPSDRPAWREDCMVPCHWICRNTQSGDCFSCLPCRLSWQSHLSQNIFPLCSWYHPLRPHRSCRRLHLAHLKHKKTDNYLACNTQHNIQQCYKFIHVSQCLKSKMFMQWQSGKTGGAAKKAMSHRLCTWKFLENINLSLTRTFSTVNNKRILHDFFFNQNEDILHTHNFSFFTLTKNAN